MSGPVVTCRQAKDRRRAVADELRAQGYPEPFVQQVQGRMRHHDRLRRGWALGQALVGYVV